MSVKWIIECISRTQVLDVRREREWEGDGHIKGVSWWPLDNFKVAAPEIDRDVPMGCTATADTAV
jgi:hypothetical protein